MCTRACLTKAGMMSTVILITVTLCLSLAGYFNTHLSKANSPVKVLKAGSSNRLFPQVPPVLKPTLKKYDAVAVGNGTQKIALDREVLRNGSREKEGRTEFGGVDRQDVGTRNGDKSGKNYGNQPDKNSNNNKNNLLISLNKEETSSESGRRRQILTYPNLDKNGNYSTNRSRKKQVDQISNDQNNENKTNHNNNSDTSKMPKIIPPLLQKINSNGKKTYPTNQPTENPMSSYTKNFTQNITSTRNGFRNFPLKQQANKTSSIKVDTLAPNASPNGNNMIVHPLASNSPNGKKNNSNNQNYLLANKTSTNGMHPLAQYNSNGNNNIKNPTNYSVPFNSTIQQTTHTKQPFLNDKKQDEKKQDKKKRENLLISLNKEETTTPTENTIISYTNNFTQNITSTRNGFRNFPLKQQANKTSSIKVDTLAPNASPNGNNMIVHPLASNRPNGKKNNSNYQDNKKPDEKIPVVKIPDDIKADDTKPDDMNPHDMKESDVIINQKTERNYQPELPYNIRAIIEKNIKHRQMEMKKNHM